jgi:class 3 adenylate cyclase
MDTSAPAPVPPKEPPLGPHDPRLFLTLLLGNLGGALVTFAYFRFLDPSAMDSAARLGWSETLYFVAGFSALFLFGRRIAARWAGPVVRHVGALPATPQAAPLRRRAVLVPAFFAVLTYAGWVLSALIWGVVWPLLSGYFQPASALRQSFGIMVVSGTLVSVFIFLATEHHWRRRLPVLLPEGDLSATGAPRLPVRLRLLVLFLLIGVMPLAVQSVATLVRANTLLGADEQAHEAIVRNLVLVQVVLAVAGLLVAVQLAGFVAGSVARPLRQLRAAMARVEQGALDTRCPVVSNDEIGEVTEGFNRMVAGLRDRERIRDTFGKYVGAEVRDEILSGRSIAAGGQREVSILFADLRDFTPWVESRPPEEVVAGLNAYFTEMDAAIRAHGGLVLQFIGDEIEAVFGAPQSDPLHADHAVAAALEMQARLAAWNADRAQRGERVLRHGIGIHSGTVVAANIGSSERMAYALVGDAVNVASRIESLNKQFGTEVLLSGATRALLAAPPPLVAMPSVRVKGRTAEVEVFGLGPA